MVMRSISYLKWKIFSNLEKLVEVDLSVAIAVEGKHDLKREIINLIKSLS